MEEYPQRVRRITALKETKRGRMAVFFDGEFDFSVDDETLLRHDLKVGKRLDERAYEQLREQTQYQKAKEKAFSLLSRRSYASALRRAGADRRPGLRPARRQGSCPPQALQPQPRAAGACAQRHWTK